MKPIIPALPKPIAAQVHGKVPQFLLTNPAARHALVAATSADHPEHAEHLATLAEPASAQTALANITQLTEPTLASSALATVQNHWKPATATAVCAAAGFVPDVILHALLPHSSLSLVHIGLTYGAAKTAAGVAGVVEGVVVAGGAVAAVAGAIAVVGGGGAAAGGAVAGGAAAGGAAAAATVAAKVAQKTHLSARWGWGAGILGSLAGAGLVFGAPLVTASAGIAMAGIAATKSLSTFFTTHRDQKTTYADTLQLTDAAETLHTAAQDPYVHQTIFAENPTIFTTLLDQVREEIGVALAKTDTATRTCAARITELQTALKNPEHTFNGLVPAARQAAQSDLQLQLDTAKLELKAQQKHHDDMTTQQTNLSTFSAQLEAALAARDTTASTIERLEKLHAGHAAIRAAEAQRTAQELAFRSLMQEIAESVGRTTHLLEAQHELDGEFLQLETPAA